VPDRHLPMPVANGFVLASQPGRDRAEVEDLL
jgi:hypothetical protein